MKIGIFDSGLGGLLITHSLSTKLPEYDYLYLGDTARVPYGDRSQSTIYEFTTQALDHLIAEGCSLIIIACNTASAEALRQIQQTYIHTHPDIKVLGVLVPAAEAAVGATSAGDTIGVIATASTIESGAFDREIAKLNPHFKVISQATPLLVPLIENDALKWVPAILASYLDPLKTCHTIILGCTHYPYIKTQIREQVGQSVKIISQDEIIPDKLRAYLAAHPEVASKLAKSGGRQFQVTDLTDQAVRQAARLYGENIQLTLVRLAD